MERLQYLIDLYMPYLTTTWILCLICFTLIAVPLSIYIVSVIDSKYRKIGKFLSFNILYLTIIYFCTALILEFTWLESFIVTIFISGISLIMYVCFYIIQSMFILVLNLFKPKKKSTATMCIRKDKTENKVKSVTNTEQHTYTITKDVSRFTSNYLKSFMKNGTTINRFQVMVDNKEDYIMKLEPLLVSKDPTYDIDTRTVAEFYYNYYVKKFSE